VKRPRRLAASLAAVLFATACDSLPGGGSRSSPPEGGETAAPVRSGAFAEAEALIKAGNVDAALAQLEGSSSPEALYLQGAAWAKRSETAPLPTPEAIPPGSPKGTQPVVPEYKPEELTAVGFFEKAIAGSPGDPRPHLGLARLLAPHAQRQYDAARAFAAAAAEAATKKKSKRPPVLAAPTVPPGADASPARVAKAYRDAVAAEGPQAKDPTALEELFTFAVRVGQLEDADWARRQAIERNKEDADVLIAYGDFLAKVKKDGDAAIMQYRQALIWRAEDITVKERIAAVHVGTAHDHLANNELALAEVAYREALKWATDRSTPLHQDIQAEIERLKTLRSN
jgi:hypothetical protein